MIVRCDVPARYPIRGILRRMALFTGRQVHRFSVCVQTVSLRRRRGDILTGGIVVTYQEAEAYIHSLLRFGSKLGLSRIRTLLDRLGNPQDKLEFVHIAGTNGKGSTTAMTSEVLRRAGYRVGMYISPYVVDFRERFQVNGEMIGKERFAELLGRIRPHIDEMNAAGDEITEFEAITALAFCYFAEEKCEIVCLEVGLGGKYDATNVIGTPLAAAITSISLDHTEILGDTVEQITGEKAGIIKPGGLVVTDPFQQPEAVAVLMARCAEAGATLLTPNPGAIRIESSDLSGSVFTYGENRYRLSLIGAHQVHNAAIVLEIIHVLRQKGFAIPHEAVKEGLSHTSFPARFEIVRRQPLIVIDGAHNRHGGVALEQTLREAARADGRKITAIIGMMADKDYVTVLSLIAPLCEHVVAVSVSNRRVLPPEKLAAQVKPYCADVYPIPDQRQALAKALELAGEDGMILICGSLYLAADIRPLVMALD